VSPLSLCIVGCGRIALRHARAARRLRRDLILSFASRDPAKAEAYRRRFGGREAFGSYEAAAASPLVDALLFCTPHDRHVEDAELASAHGKHVLLEKPIARSLEEADRILDATRAAGSTLLVAEHFAFMPAVRMARRLVASGLLGPLRQIQIIARGYRVPSDWRTSLDAAGGGALIDGGIHYVNLLFQWGGQVESLYALRPPQTIHDMKGEDSLILLARMANGAVGIISNSIGTPGLSRQQFSSVTGTDGSLVVHNQGRYLRLRSRRGRALRSFVRDLRGLEAQLREFVDAVRTHRPPLVDGEAGRRDLAFVLAAYRSVAEGRPVAFRVEG
jgi:predicted dehydrogenase